MAIIHWMRFICLLHIKFPHWLLTFSFSRAYAILHIYGLVRTHYVLTAALLGGRENLYTEQMCVSVCVFVFGRELRRL